ncbi:MAG: hypothetical protein WAV54_00370 [Acidimicrobiales bacterium]
MERIVTLVKAFLMLTAAVLAAIGIGAGLGMRLGGMGSSRR